MARRLAFLVALALAPLGLGCHGGKSPELRILGVHEELRQDIVFVQVTNPASRAMRLTKLEYKFAAGGTTVSSGELALAREVPAGAAIVVEVPLEATSEQPMTLSGRLTAELDRIVQTFSVFARVQPSQSR